MNAVLIDFTFGAIRYCHLTVQLKQMQVLEYASNIDHATWPASQQVTLLPHLLLVKAGMTADAFIP